MGKRSFWRMHFRQIYKISLHFLGKLPLSPLPNLSQAFFITQQAQLYYFSPVSPLIFLHNIQVTYSAYKNSTFNLLWQIADRLV